MRIYPDQTGRRIDLIARDLAVVLALVLFALIALEVHDAVDKLAVLGEGVESAGKGVSGGFEAAADAVDGTPLIGDDLGDALRGAGEGSGGKVQDLGRGGSGRRARSRQPARLPFLRFARSGAPAAGGAGRASARYGV